VIFDHKEVRKAMPVEITRLEAGAYRAALSGNIPLDALLTAQARGAQLAREHGDPAYVLIIDIARDTTMPFDLRQAGQLMAQHDALAVLSVGASFHIRFLVTLLGRLFTVGRVEHHNSLDDALRRARVILAEQTAG
jgi:hypothetical protein